jgi:hypothetical protein
VRVTRIGALVALLVLLTTALGASQSRAPLANGRAWPTSFRPYGPTSPWNRRVSARPKIAAYSEEVIEHQFPNNTNARPFRANEAGQYDYGHPVYFASASDPLVKLVCKQYCNTADNGGAPTRARIPAKARPAGGGDAHMAVVQPDGTEIDFWALYGTPGGGAGDPPRRQTRDWRTGDTATAGNITNCGNFYSGPGVVARGPASTAGGACVGAGIITAPELVNGRIDHALFLIGECGVGDVYPAFPTAKTGHCTSGLGPPLGGRLWYDVPAEVTNANRDLRPWEKAVLNALHDYGAYLEDNYNGGAYFTGLGFLVAASAESGYNFGEVAADGAGDPFAALSSQGWRSIRMADTLTTARWIGADPWSPRGVDWLHHLHWLDPCSARGTC